MDYLLGVVAFVFALVFSVVLHEGGHFLTAKRFGMKATQFFAGFGPTVWSRQWGETEYGIKALPLGGFVKIVGYTPLEEIDPADQARAFYRQPAGKRATVIVAGVVMNLVLAFLLLIFLATVVGIPDDGGGTTQVQVVSACTPVSQVQADQGTCPPGAPPSPALKAGLRPGDKIVSFGRTPVHDWTELTAAIERAKPGSTVGVVIDRGKEHLTIYPTLARSYGKSTGFFGMAPAFQARTLSPVHAVGFAVTTSGRLVTAIGHVVAGIPSAIPKLFSKDRANTAGGQAGSVVGGATASGQFFAAHDTWRNKIGNFLALVISLNLFLGLLNVLPLLPLDGGHLAVVCYERIKARIFRARGRPDPGQVDMAKLMPVTYVAFAVLVGVAVLLILADVINPLKIPQ